MYILNISIDFFTRINLVIARIGRSIAWILVAAMVLTILLQVFCRYVLNSALPWPEEVARAFMIWMMALVSAEAYRQGSFVAIDLLQESIPKRLSTLLKLSLLLIATLVLYQLFTLGLEFFQRGFRTRAASFHLSRAWIYLAMPVCFGTMLLVNIELVLSEFRFLIFGETKTGGDS
ncbi:MAG: TRAP transporter small permease subunit [Oceanospirillaceae bacterium]|nr:TRAP transporter small permease subunit [Oceanospirillaceae bacterium]